MIVLLPYRGFCLCPDCGREVAGAYRNDQERECVSKRCLSVDRFGESASLGECMRQDFGVKWPLNSVLEVCQTLLRCCLFDGAVGIDAPSNSSR
jgi:hypothetical protein